MRTINSIKNIAASTVTSIMTIVLGLIAQRVFVENLSIEYVGVQGLFTNIIGMLGIAELGLGLAIVYNLYKPLAAKDTTAIKSLMGFYKKSYRLIALAISAIGLAIMPFLGLLVGDVTIRDSITFIYLLFLLDTVLSYLLTYKRSILYADQKNYIVNAVHTAYIVAVNALQILLLIYTKNYILYLAVKIIVRVLENTVLNLIVNRQYPYLKNVDSQPLSPVVKRDIFIKVKGLLFHKVGSFAVLGSDNIIISIFLGIKAVGLYANYFMIISAVGVLVGQAFSAITASVGNLLVTSSPDKSFEVYRRVRFANFWLAAVAAISVLVVMDSFVNIWLGGRYILPIGVLVALCISLYLNLFRSGLGSFKEAAAIFHEDRYVPILETVVNIVLAIVFLHFFGLAGVFMGTICSNLVLHMYSYPRFVYTRLFKKSYRAYYAEFSSYLAVALSVGVFTFAVSRQVSIANPWLQLAVNVGICLVIPNVIFYMLYRTNPELAYFKSLLGKFLQKLNFRPR